MNENYHSKCPINYDYDNCSSKEYGQTCDTCCHYNKNGGIKMSKIMLEIAESFADNVYGFYVNGVLYEQCSHGESAYLTLVNILEENDVSYFNKAEICSEWFDEVGEHNDYTLPDKFSEIEEWLV